MRPVVRPISRFEFARMWGGADFDGDLMRHIRDEWDRNPNLDDEERDEMQWQLIACWAGGPLIDLLYDEP